MDSKRNNCCCCYAFTRHPDDLPAAIRLGANTPGDSDSIAGMAGSLVGARTGLQGLPQSWIEDLERTDELSAVALAVCNKAQQS